MNPAERKSGEQPAHPQVADRGRLGHPGDASHYQDLGSAEVRGRTQNVDIMAMDVEAVARDVDADELIGHILASGAA